MAQNSNSRINVRVDENIKKQANEIYNRLGLDMSTAINMFLRQTIITKSLPLNLSLNTEENIKARNDALNNKTTVIGNQNDFNDWIDKI